MSELMPWHRHWLIDIEYDRVDLVKEGANSQAFIKLTKSKGGNAMDLEQILKLLKPEHAEVVRKALEQKDAEVEKVKKEAQEAIEKAKAEADGAQPQPQSEEEILKTVKDPAVRALLEQQIAKTKAAEAVAKQLKEEQETREAIAKAKEVPNLGAEEKQLADIYKKLKTVDPQLCEEVFGIFKAANTLITESSAFTEIGKGVDASGVGPSVDENAAWSKIEAAAATIAKAKGISKEAAIAQAIQENPELYSAYLHAQQN